MIRSLQEKLKTTAETQDETLRPPQAVPAEDQPSA